MPHSCSSRVPQSERTLHVASRSCTLAPCTCSSLSAGRGVKGNSLPISSLSGIGSLSFKPSQWGVNSASKNDPKPVGGLKERRGANAAQPGCRRRRLHCMCTIRKHINQLISWMTTMSTHMPMIYMLGQNLVSISRWMLRRTCPSSGCLKQLQMPLVWCPTVRESKQKWTSGVLAPTASWSLRMS